MAAGLLTAGAGRAITYARAGLGLARRRDAAAGAVVLGYHDVVGTRAEAGGWNIDAATLRGHLRLLRRLGLEIVALDRLVEALAAGEPVDRLAAVTFDDALVGVHRHALPVLLDEGAPATVFVVSGHLGGDPPWWPGAARTMTPVELAEVVAAGLTVGAHTRTHPSLPGLGPEELVEELGRCRSELTASTGQPVTTLAYPYGHHDPAVRRAAAAAGFRAGLTFLNGRITGAEDRFRLPRFAVRAELRAPRLALWLGRPAASWGDHQADAVGHGGPVGPP